MISVMYVICVCVFVCMCLFVSGVIFRNARTRNFILNVLNRQINLYDI